MGSEAQLLAVSIHASLLGLAHFGADLVATEARADEGRLGYICRFRGWTRALLATAQLVRADWTQADALADSDLAAATTATARALLRLAKTDRDWLTSDQKWHRFFFVGWSGLDALLAFAQQARANVRSQRHNPADAGGAAAAFALRLALARVAWLKRRWFRSVLLVQQDVFVGRFLALLTSAVLAQGQGTNGRSLANAHLAAARSALRSAAV